MAEKMTAKNKNVSQIGLNTHNQGHEINPVILSTTKISAKATTGSTPDRLVFFSIRISASKLKFVNPIIARGPVISILSGLLRNPPEFDPGGAPLKWEVSDFR